MPDANVPSKKPFDSQHSPAKMPALDYDKQTAAMMDSALIDRLEAKRTEQRTWIAANKAAGIRL